MGYLPAPPITPALPSPNPPPDSSPALPVEAIAEATGTDGRVIPFSGWNDDGKVPTTATQEMPTTRRSKVPTTEARKDPTTGHRKTGKGRRKKSPFPEPKGFLFETGENGAYECYYAPNRHRGDKGIYLKSVSPKLAAEWKAIKDKAALRAIVYAWISKQARAKGIDFNPNE